jgi:hypothetical protein
MSMSVSLKLSAYLKSILEETQIIHSSKNKEQVEYTKFKNPKSEML